MFVLDLLAVEVFVEFVGELGDCVVFVLDDADEVVALADAGCVDGGGVFYVGYFGEGLLEGLVALEAEGDAEEVLAVAPGGVWGELHVADRGVLSRVDFEDHFLALLLADAGHEWFVVLVHLLAGQFLEDLFW